jgi:hypothetical protein
MCEQRLCVQVILNQQDAVLCMSDDLTTHDTDSRATESSFEEPSEEACDSDLNTSMVANAAVSVRPATVATGAPAHSTVSGGVSKQIDEKIEELTVAVDAATSGVEAVQGTHEMMGQLWSICTHQQAQLSAREQVRMHVLHAVHPAFRRCGKSPC